jgi:hypothetical protein
VIAVGDYELAVPVEITPYEEDRGELDAIVNLAKVSGHVLVSLIKEF